MHSLCQARFFRLFREEPAGAGAAWAGEGGRSQGVSVALATSAGEPATATRLRPACFARYSA